MAKGRERSAKWYFDNEKEVMLELGLEPTPGSGSSWVAKEDGQNDHIICQLKSTDKTSYRITQLDLEKLEYNASVVNKIPMFMVQFLNKDTRYALMALEDIPMVAEYINTGEVNMPLDGIDINLDGHKELKPKRRKPKVRSSINAKKEYLEEKQKEWEEKKYGRS